MAFKIRMNPLKWRTELVRYIPEEGETDVEIPSKVSYICDEAFMDCAELCSVTIPDRVSYIGVKAFAGCKKLKSITLPSKLKFISEKTFEGSGLVSVELPEGLLSIRASAFSGCHALTTLKLPQGLKNLGGSVFNGCSSLKEMDIPENVVHIPDNCFYDCISLRRLTFPQGLEIVGKCAFLGCTSLEQLDFPSGVLEWGWMPFYKCTSLKYIDFGESQLSEMAIVESPFESNQSLKAIYAPNLQVKDWTTALNDCWRSFQCFVAAGYMELSLGGRHFDEDTELAFYYYIVNEIDEMVFLMLRNPLVLEFYIKRKLLSAEYVAKLLEMDEVKGRVDVTASLLEYRRSIGFDVIDYQL